MRFRDITRLLVVGAIVASFSARADTLDGAGICPNDSKLLNGGPTEVFGEGPGTWWGLVTNGLLAAGFVEEADQIDYLNQIFNTSFDNLDDLEASNVLLVYDTWDENHNGYVCAFQLRGTRAYFHNPYVDLTFFGVTDDKLRKELGASQ